MTIYSPPGQAPSSQQLAPIAGRDIRKSYPAGDRQVEILHGISIDVPTGQMCAVMGPSGSGKSTLLYCLAGLELPTQGDVLLNGKSTRELGRTELAKMRRSEVGFVFQSYNLIPTLSAFENVALPFRMDGKQAPVDEINALLDRLGLAEQKQNRPPQLSGGEQQRVALARVLAQQPRVIFADEPTGALDTRTGQFVLEQLVTMAHEPGRCVLTVTHDPKVAAACDRVVFLLDGNIVTELIKPSVDEVSSTLAELTDRVAAR